MNAIKTGARMFRKACVGLAVLLAMSGAYAAQTQRDHFFSLDFDCLLMGITNQGWGIGVKYEKSVIDHLSILGGFGHATFKTDYGDVWCTTVGFSLSLNLYPFARSLDGVYLGMGSGYDYLGYFGSDTLPDDAGNEIISLLPSIGWKFSVAGNVLLDPYFAYKYILSDDGNFDDADGYVNKGIQYGIKFKILMPVH